MSNLIKFFLLLVFSLVFLSGCSSDENSSDENPFTYGLLDIFNIDYKSGFFNGLFVKSASEIKSDKIQNLSEHLYNEEDLKSINKNLDRAFVKYDIQFKNHKDLVDSLWSSGDFYRIEESKLNPKETLIDYYLFLQYHLNTQERNLTFPSPLNEEMLKVEILFLNNSINYLERLEFNGEYDILRDDLVIFSRKLLYEEIINTVYEDKSQVKPYEKIPGVINRFVAEFSNIGLLSRVETLLGIPDSVISRGMGMDLVTLYSGMGNYTVDDVNTLALILTVKMRLSGTNMKLEQFIHVQTSISQIETELNELKKDMELLNLNGELGWVKERMLRCINYLEKVKSIYSLNTDIEDVDLRTIFIELQIREDFYALDMLSNSLKDVMDKEDYWSEVEKIKKYVNDGLDDELKDLH